MGVVVGHGHANPTDTSRNKQETTAFFATPCAGRFGWFLMDLQPNTANFPHRGFFLFCFEIYYLFGCEFGLFSSAKQKCRTVGEKFAMHGMFGFRSTNKKRFQAD